MKEIKVKEDNNGSDQKNNQVKKTKPKLNINKPILILIVLLVVAVGLGIFFFVKYKNVVNDPKTAVTEKYKQESNLVLENLKKIILIENTESPTIARVEEPEKLKQKNRDFYKNVQAGDYLIVFPNKAIIYRNSTNQIINIAPITTESPQPTTLPGTTKQTNTNNSR